MAGITCGVAVNNDQDRAIVKSATHRCNILFTNIPTLGIKYDEPAASSRSMIERRGKDGKWFDLFVTDAAALDTEDSSDRISELKQGLARTILICDAPDAGEPSESGKTSSYLMTFYRPLRLDIVTEQLRQAANFIRLFEGRLRMLEEEVFRLRSELQQSHNMPSLGQQTGGFAHDFNNLLAIILGNVELVGFTVAGNAVAVRQLQAAQKAALRGAELTRQLLTLSSSDEVAPQEVRLTKSRVSGVSSRLLGQRQKKSERSAKG